MTTVPDDGRDLVVVANRLPVDITVGPDGEPTWTRAPGGLVTALAPVMASAEGAWVGWGGAPDLEVAPFTVDDIELVPVTLSEDDVADTKANQIASAQFTVHRKIEHGEIAGSPLMLKPGA